jgi:hypothetical protein
MPYLAGQGWSVPMTENESLGILRKAFVNPLTLRHPQGILSRKLVNVN